MGQNMAGRPPIFDTEEQMQLAIDAYFATCFDPETKELKKHPTVTGLAMALGMTTQTLREYGKDDRFSSTVKSAKQIVEEHLEQNLYGNSVTGTIFNLKNNFGWRDQQDHALSTPDGALQLNFMGVGNGPPSS